MVTGTIRSGGKWRVFPRIRCDKHVAGRHGRGRDRKRHLGAQTNRAVLARAQAHLPAAEEAAVSLESFGWRVERIVDVGVAGLHRLLAETNRLRSCGVLIVAAGMEGALPGVVAGLVDKPVIALPTSVGYGASFSGLAALLGMLNCCGSGVTVVNIDNGFGAACAADDILRLAAESQSR